MESQYSESERGMKKTLVKRENRYDQLKVAKMIRKAVSSARNPWPMWSLCIVTASG